MKKSPSALNALPAGGLGASHPAQGPSDTRGIQLLGLGGFGWFGF